MTWHFFNGRVLLKTGGFYKVSWGEGDSGITCKHYTNYSAWYDDEIPADSTDKIIINTDPFKYTESELLDLLLTELLIEEKDVRREESYVMKVIGKYKEAEA